MDKHQRWNKSVHYHIPAPKQPDIDTILLWFLNKNIKPDYINKVDAVFLDEAKAQIHAYYQAKIREAIDSMAGELRHYTAKHDQFMRDEALNLLAELRQSLLGGEG